MTQLIKTEVIKGKWEVRQDTLMLTYLSNEAEDITNTYLIKRNKLTYFHQDQYKKGGIAISGYKWKLTEGSKSFK